VVARAGGGRLRPRHRLPGYSAQVGLRSTARASASPRLRRLNSSIAARRRRRPTGAGCSTVPPSVNRDSKLNPGRALRVSGSADRRVAGPTSDRCATGPVRGSTELITSDGYARRRHLSRQRELRPPRGLARCNIQSAHPWKWGEARRRAVEGAPDAGSGRGGCPQQLVSQIRVMSFEVQLLQQSREPRVGTEAVEDWV
jgi:hypothetical protein